MNSTKKGVRTVFSGRRFAEQSSPAEKTVLTPFLVFLVLGLVFSTSQTAPAQQTEPSADAPRDENLPDGHQARIDAARQKAQVDLAGENPEKQQQAQPLPVEARRIDLLELMMAGGHLMWPILAMSLLVVTLGVERALALRRRKVLPPDLMGALEKPAQRTKGLDPRQIRELCRQYPSTAANVIRVMLRKIDRPHAEVEHAVSEASDREAARLYANVRWLSLAAGISPLLGLLGTVWGMIHAFFATANLPTGANKAEILAQGIYMALVTTFAGLSVAIPAAVLAHLFEGRIQKLFRQLDETLLDLLPQLERFMEQPRGNRDRLDQIEDATPEQHPAAARK